MENRRYGGNTANKRTKNAADRKWLAAVFVVAVILTACQNTETKTAASATVPEEQQSDSEIGTEMPHDKTTYDDNATDNRSRDEKIYAYEVRTCADGSAYAVITGFCEGYEEYFDPGWEIVFPETLGGAVVTEFAPDAFRNVPLGDHSRRVRVSSDVVSVGAHCFENCGIEAVTFDRQDLSGSDPAAPLAIHERAFADNPELWGIYFSDRTVILEDEVFAGCAETGYLCYMVFRDMPSEMAAPLRAYAAQTSWDAVEIPAYDSNTALVDYPETPLVLKPETGSFFHGENMYDAELWFERSDDAPDYGFPEWHVPCGEFCAMQSWKYEIEASSTLPSADGRYAAAHLNYWSGREHAWAEGAPGNGIGERIRITTNCGYNDTQTLGTKGTALFLDGDIEPDIYDGYMRYTQICIVNGYAKNQQTWEKNGRVKRMLLCVEDRPFAYLELEDTINPQYFTLPFGAIKSPDSVDIHFEFTIEDVYEGTTYEDTCLSGLVIDFMGRRGH